MKRKLLSSILAVILGAMAYAQNTNYLCFKAQQANSTISLNNFGDNAPMIEYSRDGRSWITWDYDVITLSAMGDSVLMRGNNSNGFSSSTTKYSSFSMSGLIAGSGSVMSLIDNQGTSVTIPCDFCFCRLFYEDTVLTAGPKLPATNLKYNCYNRMFGNCTALTATPELPATKLATGCYIYMFKGCTSLTSVTSLPADSLAIDCYNSMFDSCISLVEAQEVLPAIEIPKSAYYSMFLHCHSLTKAPEMYIKRFSGASHNCNYMYSYCTNITDVSGIHLEADTLVANCYRGMFKGDSMLISAPELPATKLAAYCYYQMFDHCISLMSPPELPADTLALECYHGMFAYCSSLTAAPELPAMNLTKSCYMGMFKCCINMTIAPELPAINLADSCYLSMFEGDSLLIMVPTELPAQKLYSYCYADMFLHCNSLPYSPKLPAISLAPCCYQRMFDNCHSLKSTPELPATTLAEGCYDMMFKFCKSLKQAPNLPAEKLEKKCYRQMFEGCDSLQSAVINAKVFADSCCWSMFRACPQFIKLAVSHTQWDTLHVYTTNTWLSNVATTGIFIKPSSLAEIRNASHIPNNWTIAEARIVTFKDYDNTILGVDIVADGENATAPKDPVREGYTFNGWSRSFNNVTADITVYPVYTIKQFTLSTFCDPAKGSVTAGGTYDYGTSLTITATANEHYHFVNWSNGETTSTTNILLTCDTVLTANFDIDSLMVTTSAEHGTITGGGTFAYGTLITLTATPDEGYEFVAWSTGETTPMIQFLLTDNVTISATFKKVESAIDDLDATKTNNKFIQDGVLYIIRDGVKYNAQGQVVE